MAHESYSEQNAFRRSTLSTDPSQISYVEIFRELADSGKDLIQNEIALITTELKKTVDDLSGHLTQIAFFSVLVALSALPFLAFAIIGLGKLLDDQYWLSSLIVAVICGGVGGTMAYRAYLRLTNANYEIAKAGRRLEREKNRVQDKVQDVGEAAAGLNPGGNDEPNSVH